MKWKSYTLVHRERKSAGFSLLFFQRANSTCCSSGKMKKWQNTSCMTMLLQAAADQQAFAYEWCGKDAPASQRWTLFHTQPTDASWVELELGSFIQLLYGSALSDPPALGSSPCYQNHRIRSFWRAGWDKRWQAH